VFVCVCMCLCLCVKTFARKVWMCHVTYLRHGTAEFWLHKSISKWEGCDEKGEGGGHEPGGARRHGRHCGDAQPVPENTFIHTHCSVDEACDTSVWGMPHVWMRPTTHMNESCHRDTVTDQSTTPPTHREQHNWQITPGWLTKEPQHTATHTATPINTLQHIATHCNTLQHTATHNATHTATHTAKHSNTQQHTATHSNTLQHTATHCNTNDKCHLCQCQRALKYAPRMQETRHDTLWSKETPPRGVSLFTMFPDQEPEARGPPSKNLYQVLRGGSSSSRFLIREHSK